MRKIYLDNAATTYPKPDGVAKAVYDYIKEDGSNINRGSYEAAYGIEEKIIECREMICEMFNCKETANVVFTRGITESLNIILKGYLKSGDHVLVDAMAHNSVMRTLTSMSKKGIRFTRISTDDNGVMDVDSIEEMINHNTKAIIVNHASNVSGIINPLEEIGQICSKNGLKLIVDSAQSAGLIPIDVKKMNIDALCFAGHKGLMGPQGVGGIVFCNGFEKEVSPLIEGGTGSISDTELTPDFMPDKFEAGTLNIPGIIGLRAALQYINTEGLSVMRQREQELTEYLLDKLDEIAKTGKIKVIGRDYADRIGVVSIYSEQQDMSDIAYRLDKEYCIMVRVGMHCAPNAHKVLGTFPYGTLRISVGAFNTKEDIDVLYDAMNIILKEQQS